VSFKRTLLANIIKLGGYNYSSQIAVFLSSIVLSRLLLPEEYGFVALITVFTGFMSIFADAGLTFAIIRSDYGRTYHRALTNLSFLIGVLLFLSMLLLAYPISYFYEDKELLLPTMVMSTVFIVGAFTIVPGAVLTKKLDFGYLGKVRLLSNLIMIILMILFAYFGFSYWSLIIPNIILQLLQFIFFEYKARVGFRIYKLSYPIIAYRKTKSLIKNLSTYTLIHYWSRNADKMIIGKYYSSYDLGIYSRAYKMLELAISLISGLFGTVLYPSLKKYQSEGGNINEEYSNILGIISIINFPVGAIMILIPEFLVRMLWGENWIQVAEYLPYFGILIIFQTLIWVTGQMYLLLEREKTLMQIGVVSAIILVVSIIIGSFFSVKVIAISYTVSYMLIIIPLNLYFGFIKTFGYSYSSILKFWLPKLILGISILIAQLFESKILISVFMILFAVHLIYFQRHDLKKLKKMLGTRFMPNNH
jgi:O-antigen/teichoic acid export membrane protein